MITELVWLISRYGLPAVLAGAAVYILLQGEFEFRYPRSGRRPGKPGTELDRSRRA